MGYLHIENLYKNQTILLFKECFALEKVHGTSTHIRYDEQNGLKFFSGGEKHEKFINIFNQEELLSKFKEKYTNNPIIVFGEGYGGKCQGMSSTYGPNLKFIAFDVKIGDFWLDVEKAFEFVKFLGLEFVPFKKINTTIEEIDKERDADSLVAINNGMGIGKIREGVVLRPLIELTLNNGSRVICKHKRDEFRETKSPRPIVNPEELQKLNDAQKTADEWVTQNRLLHVLDKIPDHSMEKMSEILVAMQEDVLREGDKEIVFNIAAKKAINKNTALLYKNYCKNLTK